MKFFCKAALSAFLLSVCSACTLLGLSSEPSEVDYPSAGSNLPVTEVSQTLNMSRQGAFDTILRVFKRRRIEVSLADQTSGTIVSSWLPIVDSPCGSQPQSRAPLDCHVRYWVKVESLGAEQSSSGTSAFKIRYKEKCLNQEDFLLSCPRSNAEKLMLGIVSDVKAIAGIVAR